MGGINSSNFFNLGSGNGAALKPFQPSSFSTAFPTATAATPSFATPYNFNFSSSPSTATSSLPYMDFLHPGTPPFVAPTTANPAASNASNPLNFSAWMKQNPYLANQTGNLFNLARYPGSAPAIIKNMVEGTGMTLATGTGAAMLGGASLSAAAGTAMTSAGLSGLAASLGLTTAATTTAGVTMGAAGLAAGAGAGLAGGAGAALTSGATAWGTMGTTLASSQMAGASAVAGAGGSAGLGATLTALATNPITIGVAIAVVGVIIAFKVFGGLKAAKKTYKKLLEAGNNPAQAYTVMSSTKKGRKQLKKLMDKARKDPTGESAAIIREMIGSFKAQGVPLPADLAALDTTLNGPAAVTPPYQPLDAATAKTVFEKINGGQAIDNNALVNFARKSGIGTIDMDYTKVPPVQFTAEQQLERDKAKLVDLLGAASLPRDPATMNDIANTVVAGKPNANLAEKYAAYVLNKADGNGGIKNGRISQAEFVKTYGTANTPPTSIFTNLLADTVNEYNVSKLELQQEGGRNANQISLEAWRSLEPEEKTVLTTGYNSGEPAAIAIINEVRAAKTALNATDINDLPSVRTAAAVAPALEDTAPTTPVTPAQVASNGQQQANIAAISQAAPAASRNRRYSASLKSNLKPTP
jgi:hypothetical protein